MSTAQSHRDLFQDASVSDKLNFFQSLLDSRDLTSDQANALLRVIRRELEQPQHQRASAYRQYTQVMGSFHRQMPEIYEQISNSWQQGQRRASQPEPAATKTLGEGIEELPAESRASGKQEATERVGSPEPIKGGIGEKEEMHAEPEEVKEEIEKEEPEKEEEAEEEREGRSEEEGEEKEEVGEEPEARAERGEEGNEEGDRGEGASGEKEEEGSAEQEVEPELEAEPQAEMEVEPQEVEAEPAGLAEVEPEEIPESSEAEPEGDHMATDAAEAAELSEQMGIQVEGAEPPELAEEEEPPLEGGE